MDISSSDDDERQSTTEASAPPDGGYGWVCCAAVCFINANTWGLNTSYGVFLAYYLANNVFPGANPMHYAFIGGLSISCAFLVSPIATTMVRLCGTKTAMMVGVVIEAASLIAASFASKTYQLFLTQGAMFGIGMGFLFVPSAGIVPQWFTTKRSLAAGISTSGSGFGGLLYSFATGAMIQSLGLSWTFRILGIVSFVVNCVCTLLIKDRNSALGSKPQAFELRFMKRPEYLLLVAYGWFTLLGYIVVIFSLASYANFIGLGASQAALVSALANLGQAIGRPAIGFFSDRTGRLNMGIFASFLSAAASFAIWINSKSLGVLIFFAIFGGAVSGAFWAVITPITAEVTGLKDVPSALSLLWLLLIAPTMFSEAVALQIVESTGNYLGAHILTGCMFTAAMVCMLLLRGWKLGECGEVLRRTGNEAGEEYDSFKVEQSEDLMAECRKMGREKMFAHTFKSGRV
ncbi:major facilitator superfamily domain-containing protein [Stachybotrys elegans]|uniref:Major facilitator superfamily domain-containing protein n=1 Tax=Stachybotrys elegans TaxID=80388 RepID=A0A8K0WQV2_9HYPO|nr:major facilitator superfamily domain-containing protein [Stachybotrys elegans]